MENDDLEKSMVSIILYHIAEYAYYTIYLTLKRKGKEVQEEWWDSGTKKIYVRTKKYKNILKAQSKLERRIGQCVSAGYMVLNTFPQKVTWKEDTLDEE